MAWSSEQIFYIQLLIGNMWETIEQNNVWYNWNHWLFGDKNYLEI